MLIQKQKSILTQNQISIGFAYHKIIENLRRYYKNGRNLFSVGSTEFDVHGLLAASIIAGKHVHLVWKKGTGKTLVGDVIAQSIFGGKGFYLR